MIGKNTPFLLINNKHNKEFCYLILMSTRSCHLYERSDYSLFSQGKLRLMVKINLINLSPEFKSAHVFWFIWFILNTSWVDFYWMLALNSDQICSKSKWIFTKTSEEKHKQSFKLQKLAIIHFIRSARAVVHSHQFLDST